jgi:FMN phosphatase YigB (HAD superfamily)
LIERWGRAFRPDGHTELVSAALDIYYMRYHAILKRIGAGEAAAIGQELFGDPDRRLVEPMPAYSVFVPLVKGWLGGDASALAAIVRPGATPDDAERLERLGAFFESKPAKLALVTASIAFEAHAVMAEVVRLIRDEIATWPIPSSGRDRLIEQMSDYHSVYDAFVTATDSHEARLKPHRDLYTIALYRMSIPREDYCRCIGIEDTEPGIIALRAAGIGLAVALPNRDTANQDYSAACHVVHGGLPELILEHNAFVRTE